MLFKLSPVLGLASLVSAVTHTVQVGNGALRYTPNVTTAAVGDYVAFYFYPGNHNVVQGAFNSPCQPMSGGFYSGFIDSTSGQAAQIFTIKINDSAPIWIYCSQLGHCENGMAAAINPSAGALNSYVTVAAKVNGSITPAIVAGGVVSPNPSYTASTASLKTPTAAGSSTGTSSTASPTKSSGGGARVGEMNFVLNLIAGVVVSVCISAGFR